MFTNPEGPDYIDVKGIEIVRRDSCQFAKEALTEVLHAMMYRKDAQHAVEVARRHVAEVLSGNLPMEKFVVSKALRDGYKNEKQPHLYVARKIAERRGHPVPSGSRVPYVFVADPRAGPKATQASRAEDPEWAAEHHMRLDLAYYVEHQLRNPLVKLLEVVVEDPDSQIFGHESIKALLRRRVNDARGQAEISRWFQAPAKETS